MAGSLRAAGLGGEVLAWADVLHEGPVPAGLTAARLRSARAAHLENEGFGRSEEVAARFEARDRALDEHAGGEYVLWLEADLYDQLQLIQVLCRLDQLGVDPQSVELVSIGEYRGVAHFGGLGELAPDALAGLRPEGVRLEAEAFRLAGEAWRAFTAPTPKDLPAAARLTSPELRFLGEAFARLMQEYPSRLDGLSLTERRVLLVVHEQPRPVGRVFRELTARERRPYLGDLVFFVIVRRLSAARRPLLVIEDDSEDFGARTLRLAPAGREVLAGTTDHVHLNGVDRWIGGVHLTDGAWRYDERLETLMT